MHTLFWCPLAGLYVLCLGAFVSLCEINSHGHTNVGSGNENTSDVFDPRYFGYFNYGDMSVKRSIPRVKTLDLTLYLIYFVLKRFIIQLRRQSPKSEWPIQKGFQSNRSHRYRSDLKLESSATAFSQPYRNWDKRPIAMPRRNSLIRSGSIILWLWVCPCAINHLSTKQGIAL